jgi:2-succinyl-6-hydroxy-2,4-cyclohexadiene-1-carboxylate synthase
MPDTLRLVLAHGFTQTARSWDTTIRALARQHDAANLVAVDLPGHGDASAVEADLWASARHLVDRGGTGVYVGYSMGGRVVLHAALAYPESIRGLVLIGATAGIDDESDRVTRRRSDEKLAHHLSDVGVERFIDEWLANPLFAGLTPDTAQRRDRCRNTAEGLASSLRLSGTGTQEPLWSRLSEIDVPALVLAGEHDHKFAELGRRLADGLPQATFEVVADAGHSVHLEQPQATSRTIAGWLSDTGFVAS